MNRLAAAGFILVEAAVVVLAYFPCVPGFMAALLPAMGGALLYGFSKGGRHTLTTYRRACRQIEAHGELGAAFVRSQVTVDDENAYFQLQGVYLAAKKLGRVDEFRRLRRTFHCCIPNF